MEEEITKLLIGEASWTRDGVTHYAIGERAIPSDPGTFLAYTACGKHDIPPGKAVTVYINRRRTAPETVTCAGCLAKEAA